jgi:hypothetical protein
VLDRMATSPPGQASARKGDVMSGLEVRSPVQAGRSTVDLADKMLAQVRGGEGGQPSAVGDAAQADNVKSRASPAGLADLTVRVPPGPKAPAQPPSIPTKPTVAAVAAAQAAKAQVPQALSGQAQAQPAQAAAAKAAPGPAAPPATATAPITASSLINQDAPWLPPEPERKAAFLNVYRYWHRQVRPEYAAKALPALLFLVTALPVMVKARDTLKELNLWEPPGDQSRQARDQHSAWKKYCEFLPRAQQALQELDAYKHLSLLSGLDDLMSRITAAEKRFREGPPKR